LEKEYRVLIDFISKVLHTIINKHIGIDKAYQEVAKSYRKALSIIKPKTLYRTSYRVVSDYYTLRYIEKKIYGKHGGTKRLARLWLLYRGELVEELNELGNLERIKKRIAKSLPSQYPTLEEITSELSREEQLAVTYSFPLWFVRKLTNLLGHEEAAKLLDFLNKEKWWIRVNTLKADVDKVVQKLDEKGVVVRVDRDLPYMLEVIDYSEPLHHLREMWTGEIVFQDKASAMVVEALDPQPGETILDMAAAPGIKDTLIMQLTNNQARIIAVDVSRRRIERAKKVLKLYGVDLSKVDIIQADSTLLDIRGEIDKILIDAPCTSTGAVIKDPAIKVHLDSEEWVSRFPPLQYSILLNSLKYSGSEIIYAVCSILPDEAEEHLEKIQDRISILEPSIPGHSGYRRYSTAYLVRRFFPHIHSTQGFFIAKIRAKS